MRLYKPYPTYMDSGVAWLGMVPEHWSIIRLRYLLAEKKRKVTPFLPCGAISFGNVVYKDSESIPTETRATYQEVLRGEFLINPINLNYDLKSLRTGLSEIDVCVSPAYIVLNTITDSDKRFLKYLLFCFDILHMKTLGAGVRQTITFEEIGGCYICLPSLSEQQIIANILDRETARIDTLIEKKARFIELLREKRQTLITQAVTKGLDSNAKMKDSGVDRLGQVPEHWAVTRLKFVAYKIIDCPHETPVYSDEGDFPVIRTADIGCGTIDFSRMKLVNNDEYEKRIRRCSLESGDIVYSREGERWGFAALIPPDIKACLGQRMMQFRCDKDIVPDYLMWHLNSDAVYNQGKVDIVETTSPHVNVETVRNYFLCLPPLLEQKAIVEYINSKIRDIDNIQYKIAKSIDLLKERRIALITAAVTGQIDLREAAP
ncbi:restriction endonuclease subunit S [Dendrosporobacter sp. 1207_IL3150]|uniref:restriction endonuclease subunit S n=1 Tax=Dendrosporobacter sp. 1207_IL3150 TaxID=3084054 RepID=UPI002FDA6003